MSFVALCRYPLSLCLMLPLLLGLTACGAAPADPTGHGLSMERRTLSVSSASAPSEGRLLGQRPPSKPCSGLRRADGRRAAPDRTPRPVAGS